MFLNGMIKNMKSVLDGKKWLFCNHNDDSEDTFFENIDDVMNHKIGDDKLIDICTKFTVIERTF